MPSITGAPLEVVAGVVAGVLVVLSLEEPHPQNATTATTAASVLNTPSKLAGTMAGMDAARAAAARDRAERVVFEALPELDAVPRRALALAVLADVPRAGIASEVGLGGAELSTALAGARKALRRTRTELGSGGRCERAERAVSDRLDGVLSPMDERFLTAHLARCMRCRTHESELMTALGQLRATFAVPLEPVAPAAEEPPPPRARLRVVPPAPLLPPAPQPPALDAPEPPPEIAAPPEPPAVEAAPGPPAVEAAPEPPAVEAAPEPPPIAPAPEPPVVEPPVAEPPLEPAAREPDPTPAPAALPARRHTAAVARHQRIRAALPVAVAVLIAVGLVAAAIALLSAFGADTNVRAPWDGPDAPVVHPAPLSDQ
jgi:hypothetical protein